MLNHQLDAIEYTALTEQQVRLAMMTIIDAASEAIDELNAYGSGLRREEAQWITIDQLAEWLSNEMQFTNIDIYSFISKFLSLIAYYQTPVVHKGMCVIVSSPRDDDSRFNEIFLARMPIEKNLRNVRYILYGRYFLRRLRGR